ncbi:hypothetical protein DXG01_005343 [Tephrocybe rancida]|nr:hypothetical protein DXG01_005343 [Tephrocybe rancida]
MPLISLSRFLPKIILRGITASDASHPGASSKAGKLKTGLPPEHPVGTNSASIPLRSADTSPPGLSHANNTAKDVYTTTEDLDLSRRRLAPAPPSHPARSSLRPLPKRSARALSVDPPQARVDSFSQAISREPGIALPSRAHLHGRPSFDSSHSSEKTTCEPLSPFADVFAINTPTAGNSTNSALDISHSTGTTEDAEFLNLTEPRIVLAAPLDPFANPAFSSKSTISLDSIALGFLDSAASGAVTPQEICHPGDTVTPPSLMMPFKSHTNPLSENSVPFPSYRNEGPFSDIYGTDDLALESARATPPRPSSKASRITYDFLKVNSINVLDWALIDDDYCVPEHVQFRRWVKSQHVVEWRRYRVPKRLSPLLEDHEYLVVKFACGGRERFVRFERRGKDDLTGEPKDLVTSLICWPDGYLVNLRESHEFRSKHHQPDLLDLFLAVRLIHRTPTSRYFDRPSHWYAVLLSHVLNGKGKGVGGEDHLKQKYGSSKWNTRRFLRKSSPMDRHDVMADVEYFRGYLEDTRTDLMERYPE